MSISIQQLAESEVVESEAKELIQLGAKAFQVTGLAKYDLDMLIGLDVDGKNIMSIDKYGQIKFRETQEVASCLWTGDKLIILIL